MITKIVASLAVFSLFSTLIITIMYSQHMRLWIIAVTIILMALFLICSLFIMLIKRMEDKHSGNDDNETNRRYRR